MVQINMTRDDKEAVNGIDRSQLQRLIDKCIYEDANWGDSQPWALSLRVVRNLSTSQFRTCPD